MLAVITVFKFIFRYLSGVIAVLFRVAGLLALLVSVLVVVLGFSEISGVIWSAIGGMALFVLPFLRTGALYTIDLLIEGLKSVLML